MRYTHWLRNRLGTGRNVGDRACLAIVMAAGLSFFPQTAPAAADNVSAGPAMASDQHRLFVRSGAASGGDGQSWNAAYPHLQDALDAAEASGGTVSEIWVAAGVYKPDRDNDNPQGTGDREATFQLIDGVAIYGGFAGTEDPATFDLADRDFIANETILSGDLLGNDNANVHPYEFTRQDNSYLVVIGATNATLDGFTITGGNDDGGSSGAGGGMSNEGSSPTVANCTFSGNVTFGDGGGMSNGYSNPTVTNCTFSGNVTLGDGGGMRNYSSSPTVANCTFSGNVAQGSGGGMNNNDSSPTVTSCTFSGNTAESQGGGMNNYFSNPTVMNCAFSSNAASSGGGMNNWDRSSPTVTNCTFNSNSAYVGGGLFNWERSSPVLTNCAFSGNTAEYEGGGMVNYDSSSPTVTNCTFSGNTAQVGGGMFNYNRSNLVMANCALSGNTAEYEGGGMYNAEYSHPQVRNSILWGNRASDGPQVRNTSGSTPPFAYCAIEGSGGSGAWDGDLGLDYGSNIDADPLFVQNPRPGPDGEWGTPDDDPGDLRMRVGSPCIDAGDNAAVPAGVTTDLAGDPRFVDDPDVPDTGSGTPPIVDMGAYEYDPLGDYDGDGILNKDDNCPGVPNPDQADTDGDGWGDACDLCPDDPAKIEPGVCGCGVEDVDTDSDGLMDCVDNCPGVYNPDQYDYDGDGVGDECDNCPYDDNPDQADADGDGLGDICDNCPDAYNPDQADSDWDGFGDACDNCPDYHNPEQTDTDGDGIGDVCDNCPYDDNPDQADADGDEVGDACDNCPTVYNWDQWDPDGDGVGYECDNCPYDDNPDQADADGDGVGDVCDNCPDVSNPEQYDDDGDGLGNACDNCPYAYNPDQTDTDGDGVADACDNCPDDYNPDQADGDGDGMGDACDPCPQDPWNLCLLACGAPGTGDCLRGNGSPYCENAACCETVCAVDPYCCQTEWDGICARLARDFPSECNVAPTALLSATSRRTHGAEGEFDINLPVNTYADTGIESRAGGPRQVVLTFSGSAAGASVQASAGAVDAVVVNGAEVTVELSGVPNATCLTLTASGIPGLQGNASVHIRVLAGDVNGDGSVNVLDLVQIRNQLNQPATGANFRADVTADGLINVLDLVQVRNRLNTSVACTPTASIVSISSTTPNGTYGVGSSINVTVTFDRPLTLSGGTLDIMLDTGAIVSVLPFVLQPVGLTTYIVSPGHSSPDLDSINIALSGGTLRDAAGNNAVIALPVGDTIANLKDIVINTSAPGIQNVTVPAERTVDVTFTAEMKEPGVSTAANYTLSGTGKGTLANNPDSVTDQGGNVYRLEWLAPDEMFDGGDITITVNAVVTDSAGNPVTNPNVFTVLGAALGTPPTIDGGVVEASNAHIDVTISEGVFTNSNGTGALVVGDFALVFAQNGGNASNVTIASVTTTGGGALAGGETVIRVVLNITGVPDGNETVTITPADGNSIFDVAGNAMAAGQTTGALNLNP